MNRTERVNQPGSVSDFVWGEANCDPVRCPELTVATGTLHIPGSTRHPDAAASAS